MTRIFDAQVATTAGGSIVYVVAGDGTGPLRLFALPE